MRRRGENDVTWRTPLGARIRKRTASPWRIFIRTLRGWGAAPYRAGNLFSEHVIRIAEATSSAVVDDGVYPHHTSPGARCARTISGFNSMPNPGLSVI